MGLKNIKTQIKVLLILSCCWQSQFAGATVFTSVMTGSYEDGATWGLTSPGAQGIDYPGPTDTAIIAATHTVTSNGNLTVSELTVQSGGLFDASSWKLTVTNDFTTLGTGYFTATSQVTVNGNTSISGSGASTVSDKLTFTGDLSILGTASLTQTGPRDVFIYGDLVVDGTLAHNNAANAIMMNDFGASTLSGTGTISSTDLTIQKVIFQNSNITVLAGSDLTINCKVGMDVITITNNGSVEFNYDLDYVGGPGAPTPIWTQGVNSTLKIGETIFATSGVLNASAAGNLVEYNKAGAQTVLTASGNQYYHLTLSGSGSKTLANDLDADGNLTISGTAAFDPAADNVALAGNLVVNGSMSAGTGSSRFAFNGTGAVTGTGTPNFHNLVLSGSLTGHSSNMNVDGAWANTGGTFTHNSGTVTFNGSAATTVGSTGTGNFNNVILNHTAASNAITLTSAIGVDGTITFTDGHLVTTATNLLTIGVSGAASGASDNSFVLGPVAKNTNSTSAFFFPVGAGKLYRSIAITPTSTNATTFTAAYFGAPQTQGAGLSGLNHISQLEYWEMARAGGTPADAAVTLSWNAASAVDNLTDIRVAQWNGANWIDDGNAATTGTAAAGTVRSNTVTSFTTKYFTLGSSTVNNPMGVAGDVRYSVATGNWNLTSTWAATSGGAPGASVPAVTTTVYVEGGFTVSLVAATTVATLNVAAGSSLAMGANKLTVTNSLNHNGTITSTADIDLSGTALGGTGSMTLTGSLFNFLTTGSEISASANLTFNNSVRLAVNNIAVTNNGAVTIVGGLQVNNAVNMWTNGVNSSLSVTGAVLAAGQLTASATGNTVTYNGAGAQTIIVPAGSRYQHLTVSTSGVKTLGGNIDVDGNITISGTAAYTPSGFNTTLEGNLINNGTLTLGTGTSTFIFDGTTALTGTGTPTFRNINISGTLTAHPTITMPITGNWASSGTFVHNSQTVSFTGTTTVSGTSITVFNNVTITGTLTGSSTAISVAGNWVKNGTFNHNSGIVIFSGTSTLSGTGTSSFYSVIITGTLTGVSSGNFNVAGDWNNNGGTFTHNTGTVTFNGTTTQTFYNTGTGNFRNVTLNNTTGGFALVMSGAATVDGAFTFTDGHIIASGSNYFTINTTGSFSGAADSTHCKGPFGVMSVTTSAITFPVGGYGKYRFIRVTPTTTAATTFVGAYYRAEQPLGQVMEVGLDHVSNWEYWEMDRTAGTANATLVLSWNASSIVDDLVDLRVAQFDGSEWDSKGNVSTTGAPAAGTITATTITTFPTKYFTLGSTTTDNPLSNYKYSVATGNWNATSTWAYRSAGPSGAPVPAGDNWVWIEGGFTVTMNADGGVDHDVVIRNASRLNGAGGKLSVGGDMTTEGTGYFSLDDELDVIGTLTIGGTSASTQSHKLDLHGDVYIGSGASLIQTTAGDQNLHIDGNIHVDGTLALNDNNKKIKWEAAVPATLSGTGIISSNDVTSERFEWKNSNRTILVGSNLIINCITGMEETITNNGAIEFNYDVDEVGGMGASAPIWTQGINSIVKFGGTVFASDGSLIASASNNLVEYDRAGAQTVFDANANQYWHLTVSVSGTKTLADHVNLDGDLSITGTAQLALNNKDITIAGHWTNSSGNADPFVQGTRTVTFAGAANQTITCVADETFYNLIITKGGGEIDLSAGTDIIVTNSATFTQGIIDAATNASQVKFNDNATSNGGDSDSYVSGKVKKLGNDGFIFPVGKGTKWARIGMTAPDHVADCFTAEYFDNAYTDLSVTGLNNASEMEYWVLTEDADAGAVTSVSLTLYWQDNDYSGISQFDADLRVAHYNGTDWEDYGHSAITGGAPSGNVTCPATSVFSPFTFGSTSGANILPLELLSFIAELNEDQVDITWETASELNFGYFVVEHSTDGRRFEKLAFADAMGTSNSNNEYSTIDPTPHIGVNYYRLRLVEEDGTFEFSEVQAVNYSKNNTTTGIKVYPNPLLGNSFTLNIDGYLGDEVLIEVYDMLGTRKFARSVVLEYGTSAIPIGLGEKLAGGAYLVSATSRQMREVQTLIIK